MSWLMGAMHARMCDLSVFRNGKLQNQQICVTFNFLHALMGRGHVVRVCALRRQLRGTNSHAEPPPFAPRASWQHTVRLPPRRTWRRAPPSVGRRGGTHVTATARERAVSMLAVAAMPAGRRFNQLPFDDDRDVCARVCAAGEEVVDYMGPRPPVGIHRYVLVLFEQKTRAEAPAERANFNTRAFAAAHELGLPTAVVYFNAQKEPANRRR